jgi:hypothetical protein
MNSERSRDCLVSLLHELCALPYESERVAFHSGRHCTGGTWRGSQADALPAFLGFGPKGGAGMSQVLDGYLIRRVAGSQESRSNASISRHSDDRAVLDGHLIGGLGRLPGPCLTTAEAAP